MDVEFEWLNCCYQRFEITIWSASELDLMVKTGVPPLELVARGWVAPVSEQQRLKNSSPSSATFAGGGPQDLGSRDGLAGRPPEAGGWEIREEPPSPGRTLGGADEGSRRC